MECEEVSKAGGGIEDEHLFESADDDSEWQEAESTDLADEQYQVERSCRSEAVAAAIMAIIRQGAHHDYQDVIEFGVDGVLSTYGLTPALTGVEREQIRALLLKLGGIVQTREVVRLINEQTDPLLDEVRTGRWSLRMEGLLRKALLAELREEQARRAGCRTPSMQSSGIAGTSDSSHARRCPEVRA